LQSLMIGIAWPAAAWAVAQAVMNSFRRGGGSGQGPRQKIINFPTSPRALTSIRSQNLSQGQYKGPILTLFVLRGVQGHPGAKVYSYSLILRLDAAHEIN
jgi:hypothetical protein